MSNNFTSTCTNATGNHGSSSCCLEKDLHPEILRHVFTFVGGYEYRFVAAVSKSFRSIYSKQFSEKHTSDACAGLSVYHAKVYLDERKFISYFQDEKHFMKIKMQNILDQAVVHNNFDVIEWILQPSYHTVKHVDVSCRAAMRHGKVDCLRYFLAKDKTIMEFLLSGYWNLYEAAENGQLGVLKFVSSKYSVHNQFWIIVSHLAAKHGHVECLQYVHDEGECYRSCYSAAAEHGHLDCIIYLYENNVVTLESSGQEGAMRAAARGSYRCFQYLYDRNFSWNEIDCFKAALRGGNFECVDFIFKVYPGVLRNNILDSTDFEAAARSGNLECLQFLFEKRCPWDSRASSAAAAVGSIDCLQYLHENGCPIDRGCTSAAVNAGSIECLRYLRENGCEWNGDSCCTSAVFKGSKEHLPCLRYLHENGCALRPELYQICISQTLSNRSNEEKLTVYTGLLKYLKDAGVDTPFHAVRIVIRYNMANLFQYFNLDTMKHGNQGNKAFLVALRQKSYDIHPDIHHLYKDEWKDDTIYCFEALKSGKMKFLKHLLEDGFKASKTETKYTSEAAKNGNLHVLKYLFDEGFKAAKDLCVDAATNGHVDCLKFLHQSGFELTNDVLNASRTDQCRKYCIENGLRRRSSRKRSAAEAF
ncbi:hypothetical protein CTEN210_06327 [Chaetoceros tenuissimus]|uniref:Uncharacterized protein n=1 Tax=Chaetoceros tenuissimus TaxID=426638 RepID=A0AAD3CRH6_9STRA|nr:hypothetical protein CTEN210_06327 [Chaetoceros tenuissimus]